MLKQYETVFIMTPVLSDEQMKETVSKFRDYLKGKGAEIVFEDNWGLRKMAYPIQKKSTGFYHLIEFKADPAIIVDYEIELKRDERIIRFLTVSLDKHAIAYNEKKRRDKSATTNAEAETKTADAEAEAEVTKAKTKAEAEATVSTSTDAEVKSDEKQTDNQ